jgi:hypothetical protein
MKTRSIVAWVLVVGCVAGLVGVNAAAHRSAQAQLRYETRTRTFRFDGHVGATHHVSRFTFDLPAMATAQTHLRWSNRDASLTLRVRRDDLKVPAVSWERRTRSVDRIYRSLDRGGYVFRVKALDGHSYFTATVQATWTVAVHDHGLRKGWPSPTPSSSPSASIQPSIEPTASPTASSSSSSSSTPPPTSTPPPLGWPVKIFTVSTPSTMVDAALANPYVSGLSIRVRWSAVETSPGVYNWRAIDDAIAKARAAGKYAMIRILAGISTPDWVLAQVPTLTFSNQYLYNAATTYPAQVTMPIPWNSTFLGLWGRFVAAMGAHYDGNPTLYSMQMSGGGFIGEMTLPTDVNTWLAAGYSDAKYIGCWETIVDAFRRAFPTTPLNLDITAPFPLSQYATDVFKPVATYATQDGSKKAWVQNNALRSAMLTFYGPYRTEIRTVSSITRVGYQMLANTTSADDLQKAFQVAIEDQAAYVEVYGPDIVDPANQTALRYLASGGTQ